MRDRVVEVVEDAHVVAEVGAAAAPRPRPLEVEGEHRGPLVEQRAADDRLDDVLDSGVDGRHLLREPAERDRVDALEAADLEHVLVGEVEALVEQQDSPVGELAAGRSRLPAPGRAAERAAAANRP